MAKLKQTKIYGDLELDGSFIDGSGDVGTSGQMLSSIGSGENEVKIIASDGAADDRFGFSAAIGSNKVAFGAPEVGTDEGAVYIYNLDGTGQTKITASDGADDDEFGRDIDIGHDKIVISAPGDKLVSGSVTLFNVGSIYVYDLDGSNETKIRSSNTTQNDQLGYSVAIGNNKIVAGSPNNDTNRGRIHIFDLDGSNEIRKSVNTANTYLGWSVAVGNNKIVAGAPGDNSNRGAIFVYDLDGTNRVKITASDGVAGDNYGYAVAIANNKIVVGSPLDADNGGSSGSAYVYDLDGTNEVKITPSDGAGGDFFGISVDIEDNKIIVGAYGKSGFKGAAYLYDLDGSNEVKITASDGVAFDNFGIAPAVAIGNDRIAIGSPGDDDNGSLSGSGYVYNFSTKTNWIDSPSGAGSFSIDTYAQFSGSGETDQDVHIATEAEIDWMNPTATFSSGTWSNNGTRITVPNTGIYLVMTNWYFSVTDTSVDPPVGRGRRAGVRLRVAVNGTGINEFCRHTYMRRSASHNNSSGNWQTLLSLTANDQISIMSLNDSGDQTPIVTLDKDQSSISIVQLA